MDNTQLRLLLETHPITKRYFVCVAARNHLKLFKPRKNGLYIVNLSESHQQGTHWILISFLREPLYFCSSGSPPIHPEFYEFFSKAGCQKFYYNKEKLQSVGSNVCGAWVCVFSVLLASGFSLEDIRRKYFLQDTKFNDRKIVVLFRKFFDK
jgi:hypothetical protein